MEITLRIPDELARLLGATGDIERRALEALALEEFRLGHMTKPELRRVLGFGTRSKLDEFLKSHDVFEPYTLDDLERDRRDLRRLDEGRREKARQAVARIIARGNGVTLGGLKIKNLINEGRR